MVLISFVCQVQTSLQLLILRVRGYFTSLTLGIKLQHETHPSATDMNDTSKALLEALEVFHLN